MYRRCVIPLPNEVFTAPPVRAALPSSAVPVFHSTPGANAKLVLDINGRSGTWGGTPYSVPPFDFVDSQSAVEAIFNRVAHDYERFNIDVTTEDPGNETNRVTAIISIGGDWSDWYGSPSGGVAYVGGYYSLSPNVGFVFSRSLGNNIKYISDAASHEAGHLFGLDHQAKWVNGVMVSEYTDSGAIMGVPYGHPSPFWTIGLTYWGSPQDDVAQIAGFQDGFGFKFKITIPPDTTHGGELTISIGNSQYVIPTVRGQSTVEGFSGIKLTPVACSFSYIDAFGRRSLHPSLLQVTL